MSVPTSADDLIQLMQKSGLVDDRKLATFQQTHEADGLLHLEPKKVVAAMVREGLITYFQGEQYLLGKWRGFTLGKYKLLERIGVGGMGQVFLCEHSFMRKRMAVKVLPPTKAEDPVSLGRFYREARVAAGLEHPNIVRTYDIDQDGPLHFLVMEYMDGTSLLEIVKRFGPLNILRACHYVRQACRGLQYAHTRGMIHRDVKPGNIMVDRQGVAKLLDMGLARFYQDEQDQLTLKYDDKNVLGTADYVAPEQTRDSRNIDIRADIYGMGATFYYVLTGQPPFPEATVAEKLLAHQSKKAKPIRELRTDVPQGIARIVEKMMAKDPKDRYQTPQDVVDALAVWTEQPIDPPTMDELPRLSPAAMEPTFATAKPPPPRETGYVRSGDVVKARSSPVLALPDVRDDLDEGATIPVPAAAVAAGVQTAGHGSDVVEMHATRHAVAPRTPSVPIEARALATSGETSPQSLPARGPLTLREATASAPTTKAPPSAGSRPILALPRNPLSSSGAGDDLSESGVTVVPKRSSSHEKPAPPVAPAPQPELLKPQVAPAPQPEPPKPQVAPAPQPEPLKPQVEHPKLRSFDGIAAPPNAPSARSTSGDGSKHPTLRAFKTPSPESLRAPEPVRAPAPTLAPEPVHKPARSGPPPIEPPRLPITGLSKTRKGEPPQLPSTGLSKTRKGDPAAVAAPLYKPPTMMPFFDQPIVQEKPDVATRSLRWTLLMTIAGIIGAGLGAALWFQFLRQGT